MIILWIDPGTTTTGFAVMQKNKSSFHLIDYGILSTTPKIPIEHKLLELWGDIQALFKKFSPDLIVVEKLFFQTNLKTWIDVAHARGVIIYEAMKFHAKVLEYTPLQVKKAITWNGQANKAQLQNAIKILLQLDEIPKPDDAADAIWMAYMGILTL